MLGGQGLDGGNNLCDSSSGPIPQRFQTGKLADRILAAFLDFVMKIENWRGGFWLFDDRDHGVHPLERIQARHDNQNGSVSTSTARKRARMVSAAGRSVSDWLMRAAAAFMAASAGLE